MLQIDSLLLKAFFEENKNFLINARVQKVQQPTRREVILHLRNNGVSRKLYININPSFYHICFMNKENELKRNIEIPKQPPMFCMLLRKHIEGARIISVNNPEFERIIELTFENYNEIGDRIEECLSIELMGKHSNIVLYNADNNIILGCAHNIGAEKSKERELSGGLPYVYPPKQDKKNLLQTRFDWFKSAILKSDDSIKKTVAQRYFALSQAMVEEICTKIGIDSNKIANSASETELQHLFVTLHEFLDSDTFSYCVNKDFSAYSCVDNIGIKYENINSLIDDYFAYNIEKSLISGLKSSLSSRVNKELQKQLNTHKNQQKQVDKKEKANLYMKKGNLLTSNAYAIKSFDKNVRLFDYETNEYINIELDENLNVIDNAKKYFAMYNKAKRAYKIAEQMLAETETEIIILKQLIYDIEVCNSYEELKEISAEFEPQNEHNIKKKKEKEINVTKLEIDGYSVFIGKNNKQNDYLYSKISSGNDIWFHVVNTPGSHIIAKAKNSSQQMKDGTILKIAKLAKEYSTAKNSLKVPVVYTLRKYVKRPNNTKSGFVVYKNETEIVVD